MAIYRIQTGRGWTRVKAVNAAEAVREHDEDHPDTKAVWIENVDLEAELGQARALLKRILESEKHTETRNLATYDAIIAYFQRTGEEGG